VSDKPGGRPAPLSGEIERWWLEIEAKLLNRARMLTHSAEDAKDLVQDVALLTLTTKHRFATREDFTAWAFTRLHWRALDHLRSASMRQRRLQFFWRSQPQAQEPHYERELDSQRALAALADLPPRQQDILRSSLEGRPTEEIALRLGITEATVRSLRRFARLRLAKALSKKTDTET
jgi:RNA polymerase sigma-70 factor (ECF subfamily)